MCINKSKMKIERVESRMIASVATYHYSERFASGDRCMNHVGGQRQSPATHWQEEECQLFDPRGESRRLGRVELYPSSRTIVDPRLSLSLILSSCGWSIVQSKGKIHPTKRKLLKSETDARNVSAFIG